jgi:uncharacterized lipoprotein YbaY/heat shock protein HslJ
MQHIRYWLALGTLALLTFPGVAAAQTSARVTGEVLYRERIALPPSAIVTVRLEDVSLADAPAVLIAEQRIEPMGKGPPYPFELAYDPAKIDERFSYAVRAEITDGDKLLFTTTERYPVITQGNPTSGIQVVVKSVAAAPAASLPGEMLDRDWNLVSLQRAPGDVENTTGTGVTIRFSADGSASGSGGCNTFNTTYTAGDNRSLSFSPIASTRRACEQAVMTLESQYFETLQSVTNYLMDGPSRMQLSSSSSGRVLGYIIAAPAPQPQCFSETGHCVGGRFLEYWQQNGGLAVFGYPISDEMTENGYTVQYFERQRLELHPENAAPYDVLLGRLGDELLRRSGVDWQTQPKVAGPQPGCRFFPETGHNVCNVMGGPGFLTYWSSHGLELDGLRGKRYAESLALFGLPLTEPQQETNASGDTVLTQWFERARFEYHPSNPAAYRVLLGRLGAEVMGTTPSAGIVGTTWQLESYGPIAAPMPAASKPATITFGADGTVSGTTGCNGYGGSYTVQGDHITFGPIVGTLIACPEQDITQQERELLGALQGTVRYELTGGKLRIFYAGDSRVLTFVPAPATS